MDTIKHYKTAQDWQLDFWQPLAPGLRYFDESCDHTGEPDYNGCAVTFDEAGNKTHHIRPIDKDRSMHKPRTA